jgi:hypothetical protein
MLVQEIKELEDEREAKIEYPEPPSPLREYKNNGNTE